MVRYARVLLFTILVISASPVPAQDVKYHAKGAVELGWNYFNRGDQNTALKRFNQALILDPDFAPAYFGVAYVYSVQNKFELAIQYYRKSIEKDPTFSNAYSNLGLPLVYSGKLDEALPHLQRALVIDPKNGDAHINICLYYLNIGDYTASWKHLHLAQAYKAKVSPGLLHDLKEKMPEPPTDDGE